MGKFFCEKDYKVCKILEIFDHLIPFKKHFPLQKLKKVCAECGEDIEGVYYTGRDKRTLCEAHYKV